MANTSSARSPLSNATNSPPRSLRRKPSQRALHHAHLDSSESYPSPHSSIYEASLENAPTSRPEDLTDSKADSSNPDYGLEPPLKASWSDTVCGPDGRPTPASFLQPISASRKDHIPHQLFPITEQSSLATLRSRLSINSLLPVHRRSHPHGLAGQHKNSFSLTDLPNHRKHKKSSSDSSLPPYVDLPQPNRPVKLPPLRTPTPPSIPSFGSPEAMEYRLPPPPKSKRFSERFGGPTPQELEYRKQTVGLPKGVVMRGDDGVLVRGRFTGIRSGHVPPQRQQHAVFGLPPAPSVTQPSSSTAGPSRSDTWMGWRSGLGAAETRSSYQQGTEGNQVEASQRIMHEVDERTEKERKARTEKRIEVIMKVLFCCCPINGASGNETAAVVPQRVS